MKSQQTGDGVDPSSTDSSLTFGNNQESQTEIDGGLFDYLLSSSAAAQDERLHAYIRALLLFGEIEKAKEVVNTCKQKQTSNNTRNAITVGVLAAVGGVAASLTLGPVGFVIGSKLATFVPFAAYQTGAFIGASSAIAGGVAGGDTAKKAAQKMLEKSSNSKTDRNRKEAINFAYTHDDFRQDEDFILRLVESRKIGDSETIEATVSCYLTYLMKSRPSHPIFRQFQPSDPYLTIVALSREVKQNYWDPSSRILSINQKDDNAKKKNRTRTSGEVCFRICEILITNDDMICKALVSKIRKFKKQQTELVLDISKNLIAKQEPNWLLDAPENAQSRLLFKQAKNQLVSIKRINSAHLKVIKISVNY
mmetsp:Transcript_4199/g.5282  ORF Transcript_4199/g.5282 Transcript_4199/m.5282 type:complete len:365 (-) Transcript_4199:912-2006(-)